MPIDTAHLHQRSPRSSFAALDIPNGERPCSGCGLPRNHAGSVHSHQGTCRLCERKRAHAAKHRKAERAGREFVPRPDRHDPTLAPIQSDCIARKARGFGCYPQEQVESIRPGECHVKDTQAVREALNP